MLALQIGKVKAAEQRRYTGALHSHCPARRIVIIIVWAKSMGSCIDTCEPTLDDEKAMVDRGCDAGTCLAFGGRLAG